MFSSMLLKTFASHSNSSSNTEEHSAKLTIFRRDVAIPLRAVEPLACARLLLLLDRHVDLRVFDRTRRLCCCRCPVKRYGRVGRRVQNGRQDGSLEDSALCFAVEVEETMISRSRKLAMRRLQSNRDRKGD
jgi:hypothetical protein